MRLRYLSSLFLITRCLKVRNITTVKDYWIFPNLGKFWLAYLDEVRTYYASLQAFSSSDLAFS